MGNIHDYIKKFQKERSISHKDIIKYLSVEGSKLIEEAANTKTTRNDSNNQLDAYGYAVYYNGVLDTFGFLKRGEQSMVEHKGWAKHGYPNGTGRDYANDLIETFNAPTKGYCLIVFNAIYYTKINQNKSFKVISQMADKAENIAKNIGGSVYYMNSIK